MSTTPESTFNSQEKRGILTGLSLVLFAGIMGAAAISVLDSEKTYKTVVQPTISEACAEPGSKKIDYRAKGLSVELVAGALLVHPEKIKEICGAVNAAVGTYYVKNGNYLANEIKVRVLIDALDVDAASANAAIAQDGIRRNAGTKNVEIQSAYTTASYAPN